MADRPSGRKESDDQRLDRNLGELLQELRVALPGVQVLFAFLLAVPFQRNFDQITPFQERVYFATLLLTAISAALLISPSAYHRLTFHMQRKDDLVFLANRLAIAGLAFLALAMTGAVVLITNVLFGTVATVCFGAAVLTMFVVLWALLPLRRRDRLSQRGERADRSASRRLSCPSRLSARARTAGFSPSFWRSISRSFSQISIFSSSETLSSSATSSPCFA